MAAEQSGRFATTQWSMVVAAADAERTSDANQALATLCGIYWYPLYAFARRRGHKADDAQDLTQGFFATLLEKDYLRAADRDRGKFRTFLLTAFSRYISKQRARGQALKRGGGRTQFSLDFDDGERRYSLEPTDEMTPERVFERRWALTVLERAMASLRAEYAALGKERRFDELKPFLDGSGGPSYREVGERLEMSEGAVKVTVHRMRRRYGQLLRAEIEDTVSDPGAVDDEVQHLLDALAS